tara:strand:- start:178 stop:1299 length:1122 start_codon:yes stop_codon:yes gene_type:complete
VAAAPGASSGDAETNRLLQQLNSASAKNLAALAFSAQQEKVDRAKTLKSAKDWRLATIVSIVGLISFFFGNIFMRRFQFPDLFAWYDRMSTDKYGGRYGRGAAPFYSMYQVTTCMQFAPVGWVLNGLTIWPPLQRNASIFLSLCVSYFLSRGVELTSLHWNGRAAQTNAKMLLGRNGWASSGCMDSLRMDERQQKLIDNWAKSNVPDPRRPGMKLNIWYDLLPDPYAQRDEFLNLCMIAQLWNPSICGKDPLRDACNPQAFALSTIYQLFDGGLCRIAFNITETAKPQKVFSDLFIGSPSVAVSCGGSYAAGAASGASAAMSAMLPIAAMNPASGAMIGIGVAVTAIGTAVGSVASGNAAKEACKNKASQVQA